MGQLLAVLTCVACGIGYYVYCLRIGRVNYCTLQRLCAYGLMTIAVVATVHALVLFAVTSKSRGDAQDALITTLAVYGLLLVWVGFLWAIGRKGHRLVEFRLDEPLGLPVSLLGPRRDALDGTADRRWAIPPLRRWPPWLLFSTAALIFKFLGLAMAACLGALTQGLVYLISIAPNLISLVGHTLCKPLFELGEKCAYRSRQYAAVDARDLMSADRRPLILLLRSYADDNRATVETKLIDWMAQSGRTFEEVLTEQLARYGPVVAIGRPGEKLPTAGAAREYLADDRWRQRGEEVVAQSSAIVAGTTPNVGWELARIESLGAIYKLILVVPAANKYEVASRMSALLSNIGETRIVSCWPITCIRTRSPRRSRRRLLSKSCRRPVSAAIMRQR